MTSATFTIGRMLCRQVRDFLDKCKFRGLDIEYIESSGWIDREFTIKGSANDIAHINQSLANWARENDYV